MSGHTKGPWISVDNPGDWGLPGVVFVYPGGSSKDPIATIDYRTPYCMGESSKVIEAAGVAKANARLIAAAPELLEALRAIFEDNCFYHKPGDERAYRLSMQAFAKAEATHD